jgi:uncharacterized protein YjeT (DUF2065 family)
VFAALALVLIIENVNAWLTPTRMVGQDGETPRVAVPVECHTMWLEQALHGHMTNALARRGTRIVGVGYVVAVAARARDASPCPRAGCPHMIG